MNNPHEKPDDSHPHSDTELRQYSAKSHGESIRSSVFPPVGKLAQPGCTFPPDSSVDAVYEALKHDETITGFTVVKKGKTSGFMTKAAFNEILGGRYGYCLHSKKTIRDVMSHDFLKVDSRTTIDYVTKLAMQRPQEALYNPIIVEDEKGYCGIVTIKDLLDAYTEVEVAAAISTNPLTQLPGNMVIEGEIMRRIYDDAPYCILYIDVDNFKAYNDAYGFENGDLVLKFVADIAKNHAANGEFVGHIGGDDFIIICDYHDAKGLCQSIIKKFSAGISAFYRDTDLKNGFIVSTNRLGVVDSFPIASLSIAGISNKTAAYRQIDEFSKAIAQLKKKCKKRSGNHFEIL